MDDEPDLRHFLELMLRSAGYDVETAADGREALDRIASRTPDLVLLDLMMPVMDGWTVLERIGGQRPPIVLVLSAAADPGRAIRGRAHVTLAHRSSSHRTDSHIWRWPCTWGLMGNVQVTSDFAPGCPQGARVQAELRELLSAVGGGPWLVFVAGADTLGRAQAQVPPGYLRITLANQVRVGSVLVPADGSDLASVRSRALDLAALR